MRALTFLTVTLVFAVLLCDEGFADESAQFTSVEIEAASKSIQLSGPGARWSILVSGKRADGLEADLTREATFKVAASGSDPAIAVSPNGVVRALRDGEGQVDVDLVIADAHLDVAADHLCECVCACACACACV